MSAYYQHVRDNIIKKQHHYFWFYYVLALVGGFIIFFVTSEVLKFTVNNNGDTYGWWDTGVVTIYIQVLIHHVIWPMDTRSFNWIIIFTYIFSFTIFMPAVVSFNEGF